LTRILRETCFESPWPYRLLRVGLAAVFVYAGAVKLWDPRAFARTISGYGLVPDEFLVPVALILPMLELLGGIGLVLNRRGAIGGILAMLVMFLAVLGFGIWNDLDVDCGCFSQEELTAKQGLRMAFLRDVGMLAIVGYLILWRRYRMQTGQANVGMENN
jgi:uncharacterized membrane protein YphA (DoxX/SURF4 family)